MITLYQFESYQGLNSPFCMKVEGYCKLAKVPYRVVSTLAHKGPRGKLPFIEDNGKIIADSGFILSYLKENYGDPLDNALTEAQKALGHLLTQACEESLYFVFVYARWSDERYWSQTKQMFFSALPPLVKDIIPAMIRRSNRKALYAQGYGRLTQEEIYQMGKEDIDAIATFLKKTPYAVADYPTSYDAMLYGFLANIIKIEAQTPLKEAALSHPVLSDYVARMDTLLNG